MHIFPLAIQSHIFCIGAASHAPAIGFRERQIQKNWPVALGNFQEKHSNPIVYIPQLSASRTTGNTHTHTHTSVIPILHLFHERIQSDQSMINQLTHRAGVSDARITIVNVYRRDTERRIRPRSETNGCRVRAFNPRSIMPLAHDCHIQVTTKFDVTI